MILKHRIKVCLSSHLCHWAETSLSSCSLQTSSPANHVWEKDVCSGSREGCSLPWLHCLCEGREGGELRLQDAMLKPALLLPNPGCSRSMAWQRHAGNLPHIYVSSKLHALLHSKRPCALAHQLWSWSCPQSGAGRMYSDLKWDDLGQMKWWANLPWRNSVHLWGGASGVCFHFIMLVLESSVKESSPPSPRLGK